MRRNCHQRRSLAMHRVMALTSMSTMFHRRRALLSADLVSTAALSRHVTGLLFLLLLIQPALAQSAESPTPLSGCGTSFSGGGGVSLGDAGRFAVLVEDSSFCTPTKGIIVNGPATKIDGSVGACAGVNGTIRKATM